VVDTVEEAEAILRELWFGWFEGIYNQDEDRIREVVLLDETVATAKTQFGKMEFTMHPEPTDIGLSDVVILRGTSDCLAMSAHLDVSAFRPEAVGSDGVYVSRYYDGSWKLLTVWANEDDLWEADCESSLP
jgi:hypothetical protein